MWQSTPDQGWHEEQVHHRSRGPELEARQGLHLAHAHSTLTRQGKDELDNQESDQCGGSQVKNRLIERGSQ